MHRGADATQVLEATYLPDLILCHGDVTMAAGNVQFGRLRVDSSYIYAQKQYKRLPSYISGSRHDAADVGTTYL